MKTILLSLVLCLFALGSLQATTYYVRTDGNDSNAGTGNSSNMAWRTIDHAFTQLQGSDILYIADGTYEVGELVLRNVHGTASNPTKIISINKWGAKITLAGAPLWGNTLEVFNCSYLEIDGLEVYGVSPNLGTGIQASETSHHITIKNCYVHDCGCGGISGRGSDYITIEGNIARDNAKRSEWNCSGISLFLAREHDQNAGYHNIIRGNIAFENECTLPFAPGGFDTPTDGNGIIIDLFSNYINDPEGQPGGYNQKTLIENNLSFNNGGRGVHVFHSDNVTVRNNTTWHNMYIISNYTEWSADLEFFESYNSSMYNNITVQRTDLPHHALRAYNFTGGSEIFNNIIVGKKNFYPQSPNESNNQTQDISNQDYVKFNNATTNVSFNSFEDFENYFGLQSTSPAIDMALSSQAPANDLFGTTRPQGANDDIGAIEYVGSSFIDDVTSINAPEFVTPGETYTVEVAYSASTNRDIVAIFQKDGGAYDFYGGDAVSVSAGSGTATLSVTVDANTPIASDEYKWQCYITTPGGTWNERLDNMEQTAVSAVPAGSILTVRARMALGTSDNLELRLDDVTEKTWTVTGSDFANYTFPVAGSNNLKLYFPDNGTDIIVDYIELNGVIYQTEDQQTNTSTWQNNSCGGSYSEYLACAGYVDFGTINGGSGASTLTIHGRGNCGAEIMVLEIDGSDVATWTMSNTNADYIYNDYTGGSVKVKFTNDGGYQGCDKNVYVDYLKVDNTTYQTESTATRNGCGTPEWLWCTGNFDFGNLNSGSGSSAASSSILQQELPLSLYPNAVEIDGTLTLNRGGLEDTDAYIYSIGGRLMSRQIIRKNGVIDVKGLPSGMYLLKVNNENLRFAIR